MSLETGMNQSNNIANLELFKMMVKHTEHGNVRIRNLMSSGDRKGLIHQDYVKFQTAKKRNQC